jgi:uncharacterized DUF497 family protein
MNLSGLLQESDFPDGILLRCGKEERFSGGWPPPVSDPSTQTCDKFAAFDPSGSRWEWDPNKSDLNLKKHGISFQEAVLSLDSDPKATRFVSRKWESLDGLDYEQLGISPTMANTDPVRDLYVFEHAGKLWTLTSTLRGDIGRLSQRVISVRRARDDERALYERSLG